MSRPSLATIVRVYAFQRPLAGITDHVEAYHIFQTDTLESLVMDWHFRVFLMNPTNGADKIMATYYPHPLA